MSLLLLFNGSGAGSAFAPEVVLAHTGSLAGYIPDGRAWGTKVVAGTVTRLFLEGLAVEMIRSSELIERFKTQILPDLTTDFLPEWETALAIPDNCFTGTGTLDERRKDVLIKLVSLGVQTRQDFVDLAALLGVAVTITQPLSRQNFTYTFEDVEDDFPSFTGVFEFGHSDRATKFTMIVTFLDLPAAVRFPYTFPMPFLSREVGIVQCLFENLKPANVKLEYVSG